MGLGDWCVDMEGPYVCCKWLVLCCTFYAGPSGKRDDTSQGAILQNKCLLCAANTINHSNRNIVKAAKWYHTDLTAVRILVCTVHTHTCVRTDTHTHFALVCTQKKKSYALHWDSFARTQWHTFSVRTPKKREQASKTVISAVTAVPSRHDCSSVEKQLVTAGSICHPPSRKGGLLRLQRLFHKSKDARSHSTSMKHKVLHINFSVNVFQNNKKNATTF